jgi:zinc transport system substrate-binding protein
MPRWRKLIGILLLSWVVVSTVNPQDATVPESDKIQVYVSILPQAYFVERVGGSHVEIMVLVGPGQSPATYEPTPHDISHLSDADVYFKIGVPFEKRLLDKAMQILPDLNVIDTRAGITLRPMDEHDPHPEHDHHEGAADPHIWLSPYLAKQQAATICHELKNIDPDHAAEFEKNLADLQHDLDQLDARIMEILASCSNKSFYVFHPSYGYFAHRYGLKQVAVETAGKEPGARKLADLIRQAKADSVSAVFVQTQFSSSTVEAIAREIGVKVVKLDPLSRDYLNNLEQMACKIAGAIKGGGGEKPGGACRGCHNDGANR